METKILNRLEEVSDFKIRKNNDGNFLFSDSEMRFHITLTKQDVIELIKELQFLIKLEQQKNNESAEAFFREWQNLYELSKKDQKLVLLVIERLSKKGE